jgi:hypothetical protein
MKSLMKTSFVFAIIILLISFNSCKKNKLERRVLGTWNVTNVDFTVTISGFTFNGSGQGVTGTITFNKNGIGNQDYSFNYSGTNYIFYDNFTYSLSEEFITTSHTDKWERITNEKTIQKVKYTEIVSSTETRTYTLTLQK